MTWEIWPRNSDLSRSLDPISVWSELILVDRYVSNGPPSWTLTGPSEHLSVFTPGMGCRLVEDGVQVVSGQVTAIDRSYQADDGGRLVDTTVLGFTGDADDLWSRLCWPDPAHALTGVPSSFGTAYDTETGPRETALLAYISANLGPAAPLATRRLSSLLIPASLGRGGSTTYEARMDVLGDVVATLAEDGSLTVDVAHDESTGTPRLAVTVGTTTDRSSDVVFGSSDAARATGIVSSWRYSMSAPTTTDAILFSSGDLDLREGSRFTDEAAVTRWARRRERLTDQGFTTDLSVITDAGARALEDGASPVSLELTIADAGDAVLGDTYFLGDLVGIELPGLPLELSAARVREATRTIRPRQPDRLTVVVGSPGATSIKPPDALALDAAVRRVASLERNR